MIDENGKPLPRGLERVGTILLAAHGVLVTAWLLSALWAAWRLTR